jgi:hypothetical protein
MKELGRAKAAKLALPRLFSVATSVAQYITQSLGGHQAEHEYQPGASQDMNMRQTGASQSGGVLEAPKKRKLNSIGRPKGSINKAKTLGGPAASNSSILDFNFSPSQAPQASDT